MNLVYLAKRAAATIKQMDQMDQIVELNRMKATNPQLWMLVMQMIRSDKGDQSNPMSAAQNPLPEQKPPRAAASVGV